MPGSNSRPNVSEGYKVTSSELPGRGCSKASINLLNMNPKKGKVKTFRWEHRL